MSHFFNVVDRFSATAAQIKTQANVPPRVTTKYTNAILSSQPLEAFVRQADAVESRLFQIPSDTQTSAISTIDVRRKELVSATPLRKTREAPLKFIEPTTYLDSVLKLGEEFDVMPRARSHAKELMQKARLLKRRNDELQKTYDALAADPSSAALLKSAPRISNRTVKEEEQLTRDMEARVAAARQQLEALKRRVQSQTSSIDADVDASDISIFTSPSTIKSLQFEKPEPTITIAQPNRPKERVTAKALQQRRKEREQREAARKAQESKASSSSITSTNEEDEFWGGDPSKSTQEPPPVLVVQPEADADPDDTDDSDISHGPAALRPAALSLAFRSQEPGRQARPSQVRASLGWPTRGPGTSAETESDTETEIEHLVSAPIPHSILEEDGDEDDAHGGSTTPVPSRTPEKPPKLAPPILQPPTPISEPLTEDSAPSPRAPSPNEPIQSIEITPEIEEHVAKIWKTIGEVLIPNHAYDVGLGKGSHRPPRGSETILLLTTLSSLPILEDDQDVPSSAQAVIARHPIITTPVASRPTAIQVVTAQLALELLRAPDHKVPMNTLKEALKSNVWAKEAAPAVDLSIKPVYNCVSKKLVTIDRKGGATVQFVK